jgi:hypothetical protein
VGRHPAEETDVDDLDAQSTGNPQVDAVLRSLDTLPDRPVAEHVAVFEAAHAGLRDALSDRDEPPTPPVPA